MTARRRFAALLAVVGIITLAAGCGASANLSATAGTTHGSAASGGQSGGAGASMVSGVGAGSSENGRSAGTPDSACGRLALDWNAFQSKFNSDKNAQNTGAMSSDVDTFNNQVLQVQATAMDEGTLFDDLMQLSTDLDTLNDDLGSSVSQYDSAMSGVNKDGMTLSKVCGYGGGGDTSGT